MEEQILYTETANEQDVGKRLDIYISQNFPDLSRSRVQKLIKEGNVVSDETLVIDSSKKIKLGDSFQINIPPAEEAIPQAENIPLDIVYEDESLLVVNKPAGMTVHPAAGAHCGTLVNALLYHCKGSLSGIGGVKRPGIVHRIDKDTSGLLVVAKNDIAHRKLCEQFSEHSIERTYYAIVYGVPNPLIGRIEGNIGRSPYDRKKMAILQRGGKYAATNYKTEDIFDNAVSLVKCTLETGRTHQIRVHMSSIGCNLIGDKVYEKSHKTRILLSKEKKDYVNSFPRQALHAATLGFIHPQTGEKLLFASEFPTDIRKLLNILGHKFKSIKNI